MSKKIDVFCCACCASVDQLKSEVATRTINYYIYTYASNNVCFGIYALGVSIIWAGPDLHTAYYETILQLLIMTKLLIVIYLHLRHIPGTCFVGCELYGLRESPRT